MWPGLYKYITSREGWLSHHTSGPRSLTHSQINSLPLKTRGTAAATYTTTTTQCVPFASPSLIYQIITSTALTVLIVISNAIITIITTLFNLLTLPTPMPLGYNLKYYHHPKTTIIIVTITYTRQHHHCNRHIIVIIIGKFMDLGFVAFSFSLYS